MQRTAPLHLWQGRDRVTTWSADDLRSAVHGWAHRLQALEVGPGHLVALSAPTSLHLVAAVLGAWHCGAAVVVLPEAVAGDAATLRRVADGMESLRPKVLLVDRRPPVTVPEGTVVWANLSEGPGGEGSLAASEPWPLGESADADALALVQLTSGSTGRAKAVPLTHRQLVENARAVSSRMALLPSDHMLSWLPLTHDMGFCGALALSLQGDVPITLMPTSLFSANPMTFLQAMSDQRATLSPNPPSTYALLSRLGRRAQREGLDLSAWRFAWAGAEPVFAPVLRQFEQALQPLGLRPAVVQPAYGMAEAVVAVSFGPAGRPWRSLRVGAAALREQGVVQPLPPGDEAAVEEALEIVSNGAPLDGVQVQVRDAAGRVLSPGRQGTLWVRGPSVASGYVHGEEPQRFVDGWYDTGDQGFLWDGEVYVTGRVKDIIARGGVKVGAHEIEAAAEAALDLRPGRVAAFAHLDHAAGRERLVLVVARRFGAEEPVMQRRIGEAVLRHCGVAVDTVVFSGAGPLPRTTSGKLQRGQVRETWQRGGYDDEGPGAEPDPVPVAALDASPPPVDLLTSESTP